MNKQYDRITERFIRWGNNIVVSNKIIHYSYFKMVVLISVSPCMHVHSCVNCSVSMDDYEFVGSLVHLWKSEDKFQDKLLYFLFFFWSSLFFFLFHWQGARKKSPLSISSIIAEVLRLKMCTFGFLHELQVWMVSTFYSINSKTHFNVFCIHGKIMCVFVHVHMHMCLCVEK